MTENKRHIYDEIIDLLYKKQKQIEELEEKNQQLIKMLDNVANYMQRQHKDMPIDDFVEWWNNIAAEGL